MKALLLQLPIPQLNYGRRTGNIPLGAACLKGAADGIDGVEVEIVPPRLASRLGDAALIDYLTARDPDVLGFTVYCWNLTRSLYIAEAVKKATCARVIFGGPEVTPDNPLIQTPIVDFRVYGEGEAIFRRLLIDLCAGRNSRSTGRNSRLIGRNSRLIGRNSRLIGLNSRLSRLNSRSSRRNTRLSAGPCAGPGVWAGGAGGVDAAGIFTAAPSPYLSGLIDPAEEDVVLVETQRGCPHRCAYCYYNKSRSGLCAVPDRTVVDAVAWARRRGVSEVFLLDPTLNSRRNLPALLDAIARVNGPDGRGGAAEGRLHQMDLDGAAGGRLHRMDLGGAAEGRLHRVDLLSELRAEAVDETLARALARAGFTEFEVGLQSTHPPALAAMSRKTDLSRFRRGARAIQAAGMTAKVDLIIGLPEDDLDHFRRSVDWVAENGLGESVGVYFLSVLPGTRFRADAERLGLRYDPLPPYTVLETPAFTPDQLIAAHEYAEDVFDVALAPMPDLDLAWRSDSGSVWRAAPGFDGIGLDGIGRGAVGQGAADRDADDRDAAGRFATGWCGRGGDCPVHRVIIDPMTRPEQAMAAARRLTHPYQIFFMGEVSADQMRAIIAGLTAANPHTPLEIVFMDPPGPPNIAACASALALERPLYLDRDMAALGGRSALYTLVSRERSRIFKGPGRRQVFHWRSSRPPTLAELLDLMHLDGVLLDCPPPPGAWARWAEFMAPGADDLPALTFADPPVQDFWRRLAAAGACY